MLIYNYFTWTIVKLKEYLKILYFVYDTSQLRIEIFLVSVLEFLRLLNVHPCVVALDLFCVETMRNQFEFLDWMTPSLRTCVYNASWGLLVKQCIKKLIVSFGQVHLLNV